MLKPFIDKPQSQNPLLLTPFPNPTNSIIPSILDTPLPRQEKPKPFITPNTLHPDLGDLLGGKPETFPSPNDD